MASFKQPQWDALLAAFRQAPGNIALAARTANVDWATAKRAWLVGWPRRRGMSAPIKEVLENELEAARTKRLKLQAHAQAMEEERLVQERLHAIKAREQEAQGAEVTRQNAVNLAVVAAKLTVMVDGLVEDLRQRQKTNTTPLSVEEVSKLVRLAASTTATAARVVQAALTVQRVVTGNPIAVVGLKVESLTATDLVAELSGVAKTLERANRYAVSVEPADDTSTKH